MANMNESDNKTAVDVGTKRKKVLFLVNHEVVIYNFRLEVVERLLADGFEVHISSPYGERIDDLLALGCKYHEIEIDRHGMNPIKDIRILFSYSMLIKKIHPDVILTYTIKPNIYGGCVSRLYNVPFISNITGLGTAVECGGIKSKLILAFYKIGIKKSRVVFFQNENNMERMISKKMVSGRYDLLPGSGVNLARYSFEDYPVSGENLVFVTIGRIMKDKGIDELIEAIKIIKERNSNLKFKLIGFFDDEYKEKICQAEKEGLIEYCGEQRDIHSVLKESNAIIHPSYHEGMSNVLLEAASTGRPILASNIPGCREIFDEGISGYGFERKNVNSMVESIEKFICLSNEEKALMGKMGRKKVEKYFDREIVVNKYIEEIQKILKEKK